MYIIPHDIDIKTILMHVRFIRIERLPDGLSRFVFKITGHIVESHPYYSNPDRNRFRYPGEDTAGEC